MSGKKYESCQSCGVRANPIIYTRMTRKLCIDCYQTEKVEVLELINKLPDISDKNPPLGYDYFVYDERSIYNLVQ